MEQVFTPPDATNAYGEPDQQLRQHHGKKPLSDHVHIETSAMTLNHGWVQRFDGISLSFVDAF